MSCINSGLKSLSGAGNIKITPPLSEKQIPSERAFVYEPARGRAQRKVNKAVMCSTASGTFVSVCTSHEEKTQLKGVLITALCQFNCV